MKATVLVRPKPGILDPQGKAVEDSLRHLGFKVDEARVGRLLDLEVEASDPDQARAEVERMCAELLANPLIESYEIELAEKRMTEPRLASPSSSFRARTTTVTPRSRSRGSAPNRCCTGTRSRSCPRSAPSSCPEASRTATTCAQGRSPGSPSDARRGRLRRRRRFRPRDLQRLPGALRGRPAPGALRANESLSFVCRDVALRVERADVPLLAGCEVGQRLTIPVKHGEGCYIADEELVAQLEADGQIVLRYDDDNPNGSLDDIAGVVNAEGNVMGLMPHPEHAVDPLLGSADGALILSALVERARERLLAPA